MERMETKQKLWEHFIIVVFESLYGKLNIEEDMVLVAHEISYAQRMTSIINFFSDIIFDFICCIFLFYIIKK